ncbi:MAG TPA: ankyrin repeat domain-containing protein [Leucothrix mucor]|uniref:Ankyrin repeat domain-containing protein n=1 Tax=Leucothrix mucor TaxID=45248 RepID=A0A7V2WW78_LEUMU|nr:ankyrin repeat domain-containing protein [Leucothrix mucor]
MYNNKLFKPAIFSLVAVSFTACNSGNTKSDIKASENKTIQKAKISTAATSSIPAWRRAASPTMTRGSKDAIFPAAKAGNLKLLKELLAEGTDINYQNFNGETVLHIAASRGDLKMVKHLVSKGANVQMMTGKQWQPIHHAMRFEHPQVANYLIAHKASVLAKTSDGLTALALAKTSKKSGIQAIIKRYAK